MVGIEPQVATKKLTLHGIILSGLGSPYLGHCPQRATLSKGVVTGLDNLDELGVFGSLEGSHMVS